MQLSPVAAVFATVGAAVASYPVVAHLGAVPVRAPAVTQAWGICPSHAQLLGTEDLVTAKRATLLTLPTVARRSDPPLKIRGALVVGISHASRTGFVMPRRKSCWGTTFLRSVLVQIRLPAELHALDQRGNPWFYVARTPSGWIVWDQVHL